MDQHTPGVGNGDGGVWGVDTDTEVEGGDREVINNSPLTPDEVNRLPEGATVTVIWSGGNGPHDYLVVVGDDGQRYVAAESAPIELRFYNPLTFVGQERFHTRVWIR